MSCKQSFIHIIKCANNYSPNIPQKPSVEGIWMCSKLTTSLRRKLKHKGEDWTNKQNLTTDLSSIYTVQNLQNPLPCTFFFHSGPSLYVQRTNPWWNAESFVSLRLSCLDHLLNSKYPKRCYNAGNLQTHVFREGLQQKQLISKPSSTADGLK